MDFSRKGTKKKQEELKSSSKRMTTKLNIILFKIGIFLGISVVFVIIFIITGVIKGLIDTAPLIDELSVSPKTYKTTVYDSDGKLIHTVTSAGTNRQEVSIDKIPDYVQNSFIAIEDERFYEHNGIDVKGIFRAAFVGLSGGFSEGASTLTQQLIKNQIFNGGMETSLSAKLERKIQEQYLAIQLENKMEKKQILEYYLNTINLGAGTYGVEAASKKYFDKSVSKLSISEAAVIASITQNPTGLNPITNPEKNSERRKKVLENMLDQKFISQKQYDKAINDDVYERIKSVNLESETETTSSVNSYFVDALYYQVIDDLMSIKGYDEDTAKNLYASGGLKIYTTMDSSIQEICDSTINNLANYPSEYSDTQYELDYTLSVTDKEGSTKLYYTADLENYFKKTKGLSSFDMFFAKKEDADKYIDEYKKYILSQDNEFNAENAIFTLQPQVSFTIMDQSTGQIKAIVGGRGDKSGSLSFNRATDAKRQPGSTFKVLSTFLPAIDNSGMTLATVHDDSKYTYPGTNKEVNSWRRYNKGLVSIREAIWDSNNIVSVKTLNEVTTPVAFSYLDSLGLTTLDKNKDNNLSMALGGLTYGVTNEELTAAYASIANDGIYTEPIYYTKILDQEGNVLINRLPEKKQVMKETTAWLLTDAMQDVLSSYGTGSPARFDGMSIAGKTGTTSNTYDLWFVGYTPYYTASIWCGYDNNNQKQTESVYHKKLWKIIMSKIHSNLENKSFPNEPSNIVTAKICTKCGNLAIDGVCDNVGDNHEDFTRVEYFTESSVPTEPCTCHESVPICNASGKIAGTHCESHNVVYLNKKETSYTSDSKYICPVSEVCNSCIAKTDKNNTTDKQNSSDGDIPPEDSTEPGEIDQSISPNDGLPTPTAIPSIPDSDRPLPDVNTRNPSDDVTDYTDPQGQDDNF